MSDNLFISLSSRIIRATSGHTIRAEAGVPVFVPPIAQAAAKAAGLVAADEAQEMVSKLTGATQAAAKTATTVAANATVDAAVGAAAGIAGRADTVLKALNTIRARAQKTDLNAHGKPRVEVVAEISGLPDVKAAEIADLWATLQ